MNIYRALGAQPETGFDSLDKYPYVWSDGSTNKQTKLWAIQKLGFNDPRIQYHSWCERGDKLNVVPHTVILDGIKCYPSPLSTPGKFDLEWARLGNHTMYLFNITPDGLYDAMLQAKHKGDELTEYIYSAPQYGTPSQAQYVWTENPHYDSRFELHQEEPEHYWSEATCAAWTCDGRKVAYVNFWVCIGFQGSFYRFV